MSTTDTSTGQRLAATAGALVEPLQSLLGTELLGVGWYSRESHDVVHSRGSGECGRDLECIADDLRLESINVPAQEGLYGAGDCRCVVRCFEELTVLVFPAGQAAGVAVAVTPQPETPLQDVVGECRDHLGR